MPLKNLLIITVASLIALICYGKALRNRFADLYGEAISQVAIKYVEPVDQRELFESAMNGMLGSLDQYSEYIGPDKFPEFKESLEQEFGGIGIIVELNPDTGRLTVLSPVVGTPAYLAGIRAGDTIMAVDGESTEGNTLEDAVKLLRGKPETDVLITVLHQGDEEPVEFTIMRAIIQVPSVLGDTRNPDGGWNYVIEDHQQIGYIRMSTFGEHTIEEFKEALSTPSVQSADGLILDLRYNAGGLLDAAVDTCDLFLRSGTIVTTRSRSESSDEQRAHDYTAIDMTVPMVVIINKYSASASEIVAACLQDHGRAVVIGERTWGKGTVQKLIPLEMGRSVMKLTTATYWRPSGKNIHRTKSAGEDDDWGVRPNEGYEVLLTEEEFRKVIQQRQRRDYQQFNGDDGPDAAGQNEPSGSDGGDVEANTPDRPESLEEGVGLEPFEDPQLKKAIEFIESQTFPDQQGSKAA